AAAGAAMGAGAVGGGRLGGPGGGGRGGRGSGGVHMHPLSFGGFGFSGGAIAAGGTALVGYKSYKENMTYQQAIQELALQNLPGGTEQAANKFAMNRIYGIGPRDMAR